jgi:hypothetical protein
MDIVRSLLEEIASSDAYVSISYTETQLDFTRSHDNARIRSVKDGKVNIQVHNKTSMFNVNGILLENIISLKLVSDTNNIVIANKKITRFDLLDIGEEVDPK